MTSGRSLRLFLVDGSPGGLITAEIMNWTGHVLCGPRTLLAAMLKRPEAARTGVYFLIGPDPDNASRSIVYLGETDDVASRLRQHNRAEDQGGKDFWEKVVFVTSKDQNLTKSHVKFLESALIEIVRDAGRTGLQNGTIPNYRMLPESDIADMLYFLEQVRTIMPVLGFDFLRPRPTLVAIEPSPRETQAPKISPVFMMEIKKHGVSARAREVDGAFVVLKGSTSRNEWSSEHESYRSLFDQLVADSVLGSVVNGVRSFSTDYAFSSPSAAAAVISGRPANGRTTWTAVDSGQTYGSWQERQVEDEALSQAVQGSNGSGPLIC